VISGLRIRNKDYKTLDSGYAFASSAEFLDVYFVFLAFLYRLSSKVAWVSILIAKSVRISLIVSQFLPSFLIDVRAFVKRI
jgi:hypothetical protein